MDVFNKRIILFLCCIVLTSTGCVLEPQEEDEPITGPLEIVPIPFSAVRYDSCRGSVRRDYYALKNLKDLDKTVLTQIDSFARSKYNKSFDTFINYVLLFYRYKRGMLSERMKHDSVTTDWSIALLSDNLLIKYYWLYGELGEIEYYNDLDSLNKWILYDKK